MTRRRERNLLLAGALAVAAVLIALAWHAGGPQPVHEISVPVAVPGAAR